MIPAVVTEAMNKLAWDHSKLRYEGTAVCTSPCRVGWDELVPPQLVPVVLGIGSGWCAIVVIDNRYVPPAPTLWWLKTYEFAEHFEMLP